MSEARNEIKAKREQQYLESLVHLLGFRDFRIQSLAPPAPDLSLTLGSDIIGVEVTEYYSPRRKGEWPRQLVEREWARLRSQLMRKVEMMPALAGIHGTICFKGFELPARGTHDAFVTEMIACTKEYATRTPTSVSDFSAFPLLVKHVKALRLKWTNCHVSWDWNHNTSWLGTDSTTFVECIRQKTTKTYDDRNLRELWLLIVSGSQPSQAMGMDLHLVLPEIKQADDLLRGSKFAKAYVLQHIFGVVYEWPEWRKIGQENFKRRHSVTKYRD